MSTESPDPVASLTIAINDLAATLDASQREVLRTMLVLAMDPIDRVALEGAPSILDEDELRILRQVEG